MTEFTDSEGDAPSRLPPNGESALWDSFKKHGSLSAREKLFAEYAPFARSVARRHHRERSWGDLELVDLYQHAYAGLLEALDRFEPDHGTPFRSFAVHRISGSIRDGIAHMNEMREQLAWRHRMRRERMQSLTDREAQGSAAPIEMLAELAMGLALGFMLEGTGLFAEAAAEGDSTAPKNTAYDSLAWKDTVSHLHREIATLPEREQVVLKQHYLNGLSFDQLAALLAVSKGRVSQLHRAALLTLRKRIRASDRFRILP